MHLLITSQEAEPALQRVMQRAARLLAPHCLWHNPGTPLLPKVAPAQVPGVQQGVRMEAGALGEAATGLQISLCLYRQLVLACTQLYKW